MTSYFQAVTDCAAPFGVTQVFGCTPGMDAAFVTGFGGWYQV